MISFQIFIPNYNIQLPKEYLQISKHYLQYPKNISSNILEDFFPNNRDWVSQSIIFSADSSISQAFGSFEILIAKFCTLTMTQVCPSFFMFSHFKDYTPQRNLFPIFALGNKFNFSAFQKDLFEAQIGKNLDQVYKKQHWNRKQIERVACSVLSIEFPLLLSSHASSGLCFQAKIFISK